MWPVSGQNWAVSLLENALKRKRLAHAYLFSGPPHVGKMTLALSLAQAVNCTGAEPPCGECRDCQKILQGKHADLVVIGLAAGGLEERDRPRKEIGIGQVREIQKLVSIPPFEGQCKVFIIDGAEALSSEAANCLLKTLEEPVERMLFVLLTTDEGLLPATVISRCQHLRLTPLPDSEVATIVSRRFAVLPEKARLLARLSHGGIGWALLAAQDEKLVKRRAEVIDKAIELIGADYEIRFSYAAELARRYSRQEVLVAEVLRLWREFWRDLMLIKMKLSEAIINIDREAELRAEANGLSMKEIRGFIRAILSAEIELAQNVSPRLVLEVLMLGMPHRKGVLG